MVLLTVGTAIPYLSTILIPYIDTGEYWYLSIISLGFPILFVLLLGLLIFWLFMCNRRWIIACLIILFAGSQQIFAAFGLHIPSSFKMEKSAEDLRVMQWNVHNWNQIIFERESHFDTAAHPHMMQLIKDYDADVLCVQEFFESENREKYASSIEALGKMGFTHYHFWNPGMNDGHYYAGTAIFSRYPIVQSDEVTVDRNANTDPLIYADIRVNGKTFRIMTIHLQSVEFGQDQYENLSKIRKGQRPETGESRTIISKLKQGFQRRYKQAQQVNHIVETSPHPVILCADLNDVPNSGAYFSLRKNLQDAFLKKGFLIGRTFRLISPTLRIDYIMPDKNFKVKQFKRIKVTYSDHYPLVADLNFTGHEKR